MYTWRAAYGKGLWNGFIMGLFNGRGGGGGGNNNNKIRLKHTWREIEGEVAGSGEVRCSSYEKFSC